MAKSKIQKYVIYGALVEGAGWVWWARVPYGTYHPFGSWTEAADFLHLRHNLKSEETTTTWRRR